MGIMPEGTKSNMMWYGLCTYWTDDWSKLSSTGTSIGRFSEKPMPGIPCCPNCGAVGFQCFVDEWNKSVEEYDKKEPGYAQFIADMKENCQGRGITTLDAWAERKAQI